MPQDKYQKVLRKVMDFVSYQPRSEYEIKKSIDRYLKKEHLSPEQKSEYKGKVIDELKKLGCINDQKVVKTYIDNALMSSKPRSKRSLYSFLAKKGLDRNIIQKNLDELDDAYEIQNIRVEIEKRYGPWEKEIDPKEKQKRISYLLRKGYSSHLVFEIFN